MHLWSKSTLLALALGFGPVAHAAVVYDATGGMENGGDPLYLAGPTLADRFVNPTAATLTSVTLNLALALEASPSSSFTVDLFADAGMAGPGAATVVATVMDTSLTPNFKLVTVTPTTPIMLAANTAYYVGVYNSGTSSATLGNTVDPAVLARAPVVLGASYFNNGGVQANAGGPYEITVTVHPLATPEPAGVLALLGGAAFLVTQRRRA